MLYHTNIIDQIGRVDSGNTVTDNLKVEQERGITVRDSIVSFALNNKTITKTIIKMSMFQKIFFLIGLIFTLIGIGYLFSKVRKFI